MDQKLLLFPCMRPISVCSCSANRTCQSLLLLFQFLWFGFSFLLRIQQCLSKKGVYCFGCQNACFQWIFADFFLEVLETADIRLLNDDLLLALEVSFLMEISCCLTICIISIFIVVSSSASSRGSKT